jgi:hypothetical protein
MLRRIRKRQYARTVLGQRQVLIELSTTHSQITTNAIICSDPGEWNFMPNWKNADILANMANLAQHASFQRGGSPYYEPDTDWVQSCDDLVAALQLTEDDEIRGDIAVAIGQQNEDMRVAFIERGACVALEEALSLTCCDSSARYDIDFALRSLARPTYLDAREGQRRRWRL